MAREWLGGTKALVELCVIVGGVAEYDDMGGHVHGLCLLSPLPPLLFAFAFLQAFLGWNLYLLCARIGAFNKCLF